MDIDLFFFVFIALVVISTYLTSVVNVEFHIKGTFTRQFVSWAVAVLLASVLWTVCALYGCGLPLHFSIVAVGLAAVSNSFYDLRYC
jgi:hypothetical protein